jgi:hypothetical protein
VTVDGQQPDAVFDVTVIDGDVRSIGYRPEEVDGRREAAQVRFDRLADRPLDGDGEDER